MIRFLLLMLLAWLILRAIGRVTASAFAGSAQERRRDPSRVVETLAPCAACGVYAPRDRMLEQGGARFCSDACARAAQAEAS